MTDQRTAETADLVSEDLRHGLPDFAVSSFSIEEGLSPADGVEIVAWQATLKMLHEFRGVPASGEALPLRGVTFVKRGPDGTPSFRRYIDWLDMFNRLGLSGAMRPVRGAR